MVDNRAHVEGFDKKCPLMGGAPCMGRRCALWVDYWGGEALDWDGACALFVRADIEADREFRR